MPVWDEDEGAYRAVLSDYLTDQIPTVDTPRWGFAYTSGILAEKYSTSSGRTNIIAPNLGVDMDAMTAVYGVDGAQWSSIGAMAVAQRSTGQTRDTMKTSAEERAALIGYSVGTWTDVNANTATSSGPLIEAHFIDTGAYARGATSGAYFAAFRTAGTSGFSYDPVAGWQSSVADFLADRIGTDGWRFAVPQLSSQTILPLANRTDTSFTVTNKGLLATAAKVLTVTDTHFYIPRKTTDATACAWSKLRRWKDLRVSPNPLVTARPAIRTGEGVTEQRRRVFPLLRQDAGLTVKWHFATVDGSDSPADQAEARTMIGVDTSGSWALWGINGLRDKPVSGYFEWYGRDASPLWPTWGNKSLRLTLVIVPADLTPVGLTTLDELLEVDGVSIAAQWELYPESPLGPLFPMAVPCEALTADMSLQSGARLQAYGAMPVGGYDGGEITP